MSKKSVKRERSIISLINARYSSIDKGDWNGTKNHLNGLLEDQGFETYLLIRIFGRDELWAVSSCKDAHSIETIEHKPYVIDVALLNRSLPFDEKTVGDVIRRGLPVGYLLFKKRNTTLGDVKNSIEHAGGKPFLVAEIDHAKGFSHCIVMTFETTDTAEMNEIVYKFAENMKCKDWECFLGVKHGWPEAHKEIRKKLAVGSEIGEIIRDWYEAAEKGELTEKERELIEGRFETKLPSSKKQKS